MQNAATKRRSRVPRLFLGDSCARDPITLTAAQAHYLRNVLRAKVGHSVVVFDGNGNERIVVIERLTKDGATLRVESAVDPLVESQLQLTLLQAVAKSEPMDFIIQKATELGVTAIEPVISEYSVVKLDDQRAARRVEHWQRIAHSACEQSGRHTPPAISAPRALEAAVADIREDATRLALDPYASTSFGDWRGAAVPSSHCYLLVGPEGGFSERDLRAIDRAGFERVALGPRVLRVETAALAACTLAQARWGDLA